MGKTKAKKLSKRLNNPTGIPTVKEMEESEEFHSNEIELDTIQSIVEKLQSSAADEKERTEDKVCAALHIANMAGNPNFVTSIISNKVIRIASPLLVDHSLPVRHAIAGCLRNLADCGDYSVCQAMVEQDILTALVALLSEYRTPARTWTAAKFQDGIMDSKTEIFLEACNLLWSLCESCDTAVGVFNEAKLIQVLLPYLNIDVYGPQIPLAVAQCLYTVGEENKEVIEELSQPLILEQLKALMRLKPDKPEHVLLKTLAAGIMINILPGQVKHCMSAVIDPIGEVIHCTLSEPINPALVCLSKNIQRHRHVRSSRYRDEDDVEKKLNAVKETSRTLDYLLQAKQISLEIIANISISNGPEEWEDVSCSESSEDNEMEMDYEGVNEQVDLEMASVIRDIIIRYHIFEKALEQIVLPDGEVVEMLNRDSSGKEILKRLNTVKCRALLCLNNMVQAASVEDIGGPERLFNLWIHIARLLFQNTDVLDSEQLDATTSSMRAVLQKLAEAKYSSWLENLGEKDLESLTNICNQTQVSSVKVNIIKSLGTIGYLIANSEAFQSCHNQIKIIGSFLLDSCSRGPELWVLAEAIDAILDVFAEDHVDFIAVQINLVERLKNIKKNLDSKAKGNLGEHSSVIKTAKTNLRRFIEYKVSFRKLHSK